MAKKPKAPAETIVSPALATETRVYTGVDDTTAALEAMAKAAPIEASDGLLASLSEMVGRVEQLEADLAEIEEMRVVRSGRLRELVEELIPAAMDEAGVASFKTASGKVVEVVPVVSATLGKGKDETDGQHAKRVDAAMRWLDEHGHDGLIKVGYDVKVERGDKESDAKLAAALSQIGVDFKRSEGVHHATLTAFVKGQLESGDAVPLDLFRVAQHRRASIKAPKKGK